MKDRLEIRIKELQAEFESGQKMLADVETKRQNLNHTLLRISGAVQVLQEVLAKESDAADNEETPSGQVATLAQASNVKEG